MGVTTLAYLYGTFQIQSLKNEYTLSSIQLLSHSKISSISFIDLSRQPPNHFASSEKVSSRKKQGLESIPNGVRPSIFFHVVTITLSCSNITLPCLSIV